MCKTLVPPRTGTRVRAREPGPVSAVFDASVVPHQQGRSFGARLMFVEPEETERKALVTALENQKIEWVCEIVAEGREVIHRTRSETFDALVCPERMPDMTGEELIQALEAESVRLLTFLKSGDQQCCLVNPSSTCLVQRLPSKPEWTQTFPIIHRGLLLSRWMNSPSIRGIMKRLTSVPSLPQLFHSVVRELDSPNGSLEQAAWLISQDPAMTARLLHAVNSPLYGVSRPVHLPLEAVLFLGAQQTLSILLLNGVCAQQDHEIGCAGFSLEGLWQHSLEVGSFCRYILREEGMSNMACETGFTAGLLHDLGKLILAANLTFEYRVVLEKAKKTGEPFWKVEQETLGASHTEIGACLLALWGLPLEILEAVAWHHRPVEAVHAGLSLPCVLNVADAFYYEKTLGEIKQGYGIDREYLEQNRLLNRLEVWRHVCGLPTNSFPKPGGLAMQESGET